MSRGMRRDLGDLVAIAIIVAFDACHPSPSPSPPPIDASDASTPTCVSACATLNRLCGPIEATCAMALSEAEHDRLIAGADGHAMTCACVAGATSKEAIQACGITCGD